MSLRRTWFELWNCEHKSHRTKCCYLHLLLNTFYEKGRLKVMESLVKNMSLSFVKLPVELKYSNYSQCSALTCEAYKSLK